MAKRSSPEQLAAFGQRLRALREELGFSQQDVADRLGITDVGYGAFERGQRMPSADQLPWLARQGFGVSVEDLLTRLGLVDQKILDAPLPDALAGRVQRIAANWPTLNPAEQEHVVQLLSLISNYGRPSPGTVAQDDTSHSSDKIEGNVSRDVPEDSAEVSAESFSIISRLNVLNPATLARIASTERSPERELIAV